MRSPRDDFVDNGSLFRAGATKIDARGFDALMPHEIGKKRYVIELLKKVLCEAMPE